MNTEQKQMNQVEEMRCEYCSKACDGSDIIFTDGITIIYCGSCEEEKVVKKTKKKRRLVIVKK